MAQSCSIGMLPDMHRPARILQASLGSLIVLLAVAACARPTEASPRLAAAFSDHAVLQQDMPVPVWGWADAGEAITVEFAGQRQTATADATGRWQVRLKPLAASEEPRDLVVTGSGTLTIRDVVVGEVWLASGQSNMGSPLSSVDNAATVLPEASDPLLRFFTVVKATAAEPLADVKGAWQATTPETARGFSAVAFFFAKELRTRLNCPVGILHASWGGTAAHSWLGIDSLRQEPTLAKYVTQWDQAVVKHGEVLEHPELAERYVKEVAAWQAEVAPVYNAAMKAFKAAGSTGPKPEPSRPMPKNPDPMGMPDPNSRPSTPGVIYHAMIAPLAAYAMRGVIWYQGEANGSAGLEYRTLLPRLIADWRSRWWQGDMPFFVVQLPGWDHSKDPTERHQWPWLREAQLMTVQAVPKTGLAVAIDVGDPREVHPANKTDIGLRLALAARKIAYAEDVVHSGPIYRDFVITDGTVRLRFDEVGSGLAIGQAPWLAKGVEQFPADRLIGFAIAGEDRTWQEATARIDGDSVLVSSAAVPRPVAVRYGWANAPRCNLANREGLPASPFRTDDWAMPAAAR
jgi:sialate O-acetylesterase